MVPCTAAAVQTTPRIRSRFACTMRWPDVFLVNGPSSAGKTTLCRALQAAIAEPYLVAAFDDFIFMSAPRYYRGADTARQSERDAFTALGAEMVTTSPPGAPISAAWAVSLASVARSSSSSIT